MFVKAEEAQSSTKCRTFEMGFADFCIDHHLADLPGGPAESGKCIAVRVSLEFL